MIFNALGLIAIYRCQVIFFFYFSQRAISHNSAGRRKGLCFLSTHLADQNNLNGRSLRFEPENQIKVKEG